MLPESVAVVAGHEVGPALFEEAVEPVLAGNVDLVPEEDGLVQPAFVDRLVAAGVGAEGRGVANPGDRQVGEVTHARLVLDALGAFLDGVGDAGEGGHRRLDQAQLRRADTEEELGPDVISTIAGDLVEQANRIGILPIDVLVASEEVIELRVERVLFLVVEALDLLVVVLSHAADDVGRLGQVGRQLGQPQERVVELQVAGAVGDLAEDAVGSLVQLQPVERDGQVVLGELLVALVVVGLPLPHFVQIESGGGPLFGVELSLRVGRPRGHLPGNRRRASVHRGSAVLQRIRRIGGRGIELDLLRLRLGLLAGGGRRATRLGVGERREDRRRTDKRHQREERGRAPTHLAETSHPRDLQIASRSLR